MTPTFFSSLPSTAAKYGNRYGNGESGEAPEPGIQLRDKRIENFKACPDSVAQHQRCSGARPDVDADLLAEDRDQVFIVHACAYGRAL
jgi:hypothetical protein